MRTVALEEHFTHPELASYASSAYPRGAASDAQERLLDFGDLRLEAMDRAGVDVAVISAATPGVQAEPNAEVAIRRARIVNDFLARRIAAHPKRYAGFAHLPLQDPEAAAGELRRCVEQLEMKGALVNGHTMGRYLDAPAYNSLWSEAERLGVPIYLHPADPWGMPAMYVGRPELLGATWAWTAETATHALRLVFGGVFDRHPKAKLILGHLGETLPYLLWRLDSRWRADGGADTGRRAPSDIIRAHVLVTTSGLCAPAALQCALAALGEDSVMFALDYPYGDRDAAILLLRSARVSETTREKIAHANADRLLGLTTG